MHPIKTSTGSILRKLKSFGKTPTYLLEIEARSIDEPRFLLIEKIGSKYWSAVVTHRDNKVRIISVRRARREEVDLYEES